MGQYTVYCNGSQNLKNLSGGVGELRIDNLGADKADWGWLFFDKSPVPSGEVLDSASVLAVYCHAPYPLSLILGQIAGPSWNGPEWKITSGGVRGAGNLSCQIGITTENQTGAAQFWVDGSDHVPYATIQTHAGKITPSGYSPANTTIKKGFYHRFSWNVTAEKPINGTLTIAYSDFKYRAKGSGTWTSVRVPGPNTYIDFDTGLVPNAADPGMEWEVVVTSSSGAQASGGYATVQFQSTAVRLTDLTPSSRATTYKGFAVNFSWSLSYTKPDDLSGSIRQVSAKLRWRKNGAPAYTEYAINNATQGYTIPAGVLPAGDIDWQVEVADTSGGTTASSWTTFNNKELPVTPTDLYPADGGRVLKHQVNRFGWSVTAEGAEDAPGEIVQTSAVLRWRTQGHQDVKSVSISGAQIWHDFPANTFTADDIEWQVEVTANTGATGVSEWIHVNTQDALSTPVCVSPVGAIVEDTQGVTFVWRHEISTGTAQTAYELQTSSNMGGQYTTLSTAETDASSFATPAGQFAQGALMWRVRTKNGDGVWGSYSAAATIIIRRAPAVPVIVYTDSKPRPTIRWQSADQQGVRIQIGDYDTGWMHSTAKEFRMPYFLQDGTYPVRLAIKTVFGVESAPAVGSITVLNVPGPTIEAAFNARLNAIEISWETDAAYAEYFVLRDGVPITRSTGSGITDRLCAGKHVYTVRGVTPEGYYGDSSPVHAFLALENAVLGSVEDGAPWLKLRLRAGERPAHDGSYSAQVDYVHYYGRTKPEPYTCGMQDASHDFAFTLRDAAQMDALRGLLGSAVVYKDCWGDVVIGVLGNIQAAHGRARDVQFTVVETDHRQEISYE